MNTEAQWYIPLADEAVQCTLCPHNCILKEGKSGICRVRVNREGKLLTEVNGFVSSIHFDPIEKKPLYHFYPGSTVLSIGTYGCNMRCFFCQNCGISQTAVKPELPRSFYTPEQIVQIAKGKPGNIGIAFTYNEPVVWYEYMYDIARAAKTAGLKTVMVTNGFINKEPLAHLLEYMDAFSVDLKSFDEDFYKKVTASKLQPVKETLKQISLAGKHLEVVNLVIPDLNDDEKSFRIMVKWIAGELGQETVLHISRYFPYHKFTTEATSVTSLSKLKRVAEEDLTYVYNGNVNLGNVTTNCLQCNNILISRNAYEVNTHGLDNEGNCRTCGKRFLKKT